MGKKKTKINAEKPKEKIAPQKEKAPRPNLEYPSTQMLSPVRDVKDGIVMTKDGDYIKIMEFAPINFSLRSEQEQIQICNSFGSIIKVLPDEFQIKILNRRASVNTHVDDIYKQIEQEENPICRQMDAETIALIQQKAQTGVSKRFFLAFPYEQPAGLEQNFWPQIRQSLDTQAAQISSLMSSEPLHNACLTAPGDSDQAIDILYNCFSRAEAELYTAFEKISDVACRYLMEGRTEDPNNPIPINDIICPRSVDPRKFNSLCVDNLHYAFGFIPGSSYPTSAIAGWLSMFSNMGGGIDLDLFVQKVPVEKVRQKIIYQLRIAKSKLRHTDDTNDDYDDIQEQLESGYYIRQGLSKGQDLCNMAILITVIAESEQELRDKVRWVQNRLLTIGVSWQRVCFRCQEAFLSTLPLCTPDKGIFARAKRNVLSGDLGSAYPFTSFEINDPNGIFFGVNQENGSPVFLDPYNRDLYENGNIDIYGESGKGKTYLTQGLCIRLLEAGVRVIVIIPAKGHEYKRTAEEIGQYILLAPGSPYVINIMEIRQETAKGFLSAGYTGKILARKIQQLLTIFDILLEDITPSERNAVDQACIRTYGHCGINFNNSSLIDPKNPSRYKPMPTLGDLLSELKNDKSAKRICDAMMPLVTGSCQSFNGQTNIDLHSRYLVFDTTRLEGAMKTVGSAIAYSITQDIMQTDVSQKKAVVFEEFWRFIGASANTAAAEFAISTYKLARAYNTIAIAATQDLSDYFSYQDGRYGKAIINSAKIHICLGVKSKEAELIADYLDLSGEEKDRIAQANRGDALLIANRNHVVFKFKATKTEHDLITTDPAEVQILVNEREG